MVAMVLVAVKNGERERSEVSERTYSGLHSSEHLPRFVSNYLYFLYQFKITTHQPWDPRR
jgi:hypothetical protein